MAEQSKVHLWINTFVAILALLASAASGFVTWRSYDLKSESIGFTLSPTYDCRAEFHSLANAGVLGLCWIATITNQSDSRTSLVTHQVLTGTPGAQAFYSGFTEVEDQQGRPAIFPIVLDSGEARSYLFRAPVDVPQSVAKVIKGLSEASSTTPLSNVALQHAAADAGLDLIGNSVEVRKFDDKYAISWPVNHRQATARIRFETGRGNVFIAAMDFPPRIEGLR